MENAKTKETTSDQISSRGGSKKNGLQFYFSREDYASSETGEYIHVV